MVSVLWSEHRAGRDDPRRGLIPSVVQRWRARSRMKLNRNSRSDCRAAQLFVRNPQHPVAERRVVVPLDPVGSEVPFEDGGELRRHPGRHVDAVGERPHRKTIGRRVGPDGLPHLTGDVSVHPIDTVDRASMRIAAPSC